MVCLGNTCTFIMKLLFYRVTRCKWSDSIKDIGLHYWCGRTPSNGVSSRTCNLFCSRPNQNIAYSIHLLVIPLSLPLSLTDYEVFQQKMDMAIMNTFGFGLENTHVIQSTSMLHVQAIQSTSSYFCFIYTVYTSPGVTFVLCIVHLVLHVSQHGVVPFWQLKY